MLLFVNPITQTFHWRFSTGLQQEQPQLYENLTKILNAEEQQVLQAVFHEADAKAMAAANAQAAAAAAGMTTNGQ